MVRNLGGVHLKATPCEMQMEAPKNPQTEPPKTATASSLREHIRQRAYELYLARRDGPGTEVQDWLQAEAEVVWKLGH